MVVKCFKCKKKMDRWFNVPSGNDTVRFCKSCVVKSKLSPIINNSRDFYCMMCDEYFTQKTSSDSASCPSCHSAKDVVVKGGKNYPEDSK
jgi:hypothetical protein